MALQMNYTTPDGVTHPQSYWRVTETSINIGQKRGMITLFGYHTAQTRTEGLAAIGSRIYPFGAEEYDEYFAPAEINPEGINHVKAAYDLAVAHADGFFADAVEV